MARKTKKYIIKPVLAALFLALGMVLPLLTGQIKEIGDSLLPMHIPVMICGLVCGYKYGAAVGLMLPFLRSLTFSMPPIYPNAVWMAIELATYGLVIGFIYMKLSKNRLSMYVALITAMIMGRVVWGVSKAVLLGLGGRSFTITAFIVGGFVDSLLGIVLQLVVVPPIATLINRMIRKR